MNEHWDINKNIGGGEKERKDRWIGMIGKQCNCLCFMVINGRPGDSGVIYDKCNLKWQVRERRSFRYNGKEDALLKEERKSKRRSKTGRQRYGCRPKVVPVSSIDQFCTHLLTGSVLSSRKASVSTGQCVRKLGSGHWSIADEVKVCVYILAATIEQQIAGQRI